MDMLLINSGPKLFEKGKCSFLKSLTVSLHLVLFL